ncbi:MAG: type II toxin-antitoxin system VapC family toxin [Dehalococcoidia bacterium]
MSEILDCLDSDVLIKYLVPEERDDLNRAARRLVGEGVARGRIVAPAFAWAEIGSVLRKKFRQGYLKSAAASTAWDVFCDLPMDFVDTPSMRIRAWEIAMRNALPTLYDASFMACAEIAPGPDDAERRFWTADETLIRALGANRPAYVRHLSEATPESESKSSG